MVMSVSYQVSESDNRGATDVRDLAQEPAPTIEWAVDADGGLSFHGSVQEVLGETPGADEAEQVEAVLAPILVVLRSDTGWDDYQLERTYESPNGPRRLLIQCRRRRDGSGGHVGVIMIEGRPRTGVSRKT